MARPVHMCGGGIYVPESGCSDCDEAMYLIEQLDEKIDQVDERVDNIIASPAPSEQEIIDARRGADGVNYPTLGDSIRSQVSDLKVQLEDYTDEALEDYAKTDGYYENLTAGSADQILSTIRANDQTPYLFRPSGDSIDIGDREYIKGIVGVTVPFNQLVQKTKATFTQNDVTFTNNGDGSWTVAGTASASVWANFDSFSYPQGANHVLLYMFGQKSVSGQYRFLDTNRGNGNYVADGEILKPSTINSVIGVGMNITNGVTVNVTVRPMFIDLTQMFGSTIADYIYSLEQANAGAGVAFFKSLFPKPYYAYNAGELKSVKGLVSHDMVGFNQVNKDEVVNNKYIVTSTGEEDASNASAHTGFIRVTPQTNYYTNATAVGYFSTVVLYDADKNYIGYISGSSPQVFNTGNAHYIIVNTVKAQMPIDDLVVNLSWDGSRDGEYEPYQKWSYPLDSDLELRGIPKIENGNLYYDGDVYESDGTVTRKYGIVDLGTLNWAYASSFGVFHSTDLNNYVKDNWIVCSKYWRKTILTSSGITDPTYDKWIAANVNVNSGTTPSGNFGVGELIAKDTAYSDAATFKTAMSGVYLVYELAEPTTETADPYTNPQIVNDFGTEEFVIDDTIDVPIPVGHNTDYPVNLKAKVEMAPNSPDGDGDYIVRQTNGTNEYVAFANNATIQNILARLEALEGENNG